MIEQFKEILGSLIFCHQITKQNRSDIFRVMQKEIMSEEKVLKIKQTTMLCQINELKIEQLSLKTNHNHISFVV